MLQEDSRSTTKSDPAKNALAAALDLAAGVPGAQITVLSVVDWHDFNAETLQNCLAHVRRHGRHHGHGRDLEVEIEAIKDMDATITSRASGGRRRGHWHRRRWTRRTTPTATPTRRAATTASLWATAAWRRAVCSAARVSRVA